MTGLTDANPDDAILTDITGRLMGAAYSITDARKRRLVAEALMKLLKASLELGDDGPADEPTPERERKRGRPRKSADGPMAVAEEAASS